MGIVVNRSTKVLVQGFTGKEGTFHSTHCLKYGTYIVGGVTPGKGGQRHLDLPVYNTVREALEYHEVDVSIVLVPARSAAEAIVEAVNSGIRIIICITEGIPVRDIMLAKRIVRSHNALLIGPNCPGIITPGETKIGIMPGSVFQRGSIGLISRSGTLLYEAANQLGEAGLGISTAVGIGGDSIIGTSFSDFLEMFEKDMKTEAVVMIGEIGGDLEERAADYIKRNISKPVIAYIAGQTAPPGKKMGHAGAIISGSQGPNTGTGTAEGKIKALEESGVTIVKSPAEIGRTMYSVLR